MSTHTDYALWIVYTTQWAIASLMQTQRLQARQGQEILDIRSALEHVDQARGLTSQCFDQSNQGVETCK